MKRIVAFALLTMVATTALAAGMKEPGKTDEAIGKTAQSFFEAWNVHDVKTMASFWTDDATLINPMGRVAHGRADIEKLLSDEQTSVFKASTAKVVDLKVTRPLGASLVFCDGEMTVDGAQAPDGSALPQMKMHLAMVLEKSGGRWMFAEARPYAFAQPPPEQARGN